MVLPKITVRVEPGNGVYVFFLKLAPESKNNEPMSKVGLYLSIHNNDTSVKIHLQEVIVSFPGNSQYDRSYSASLDIEPLGTIGTDGENLDTKPWKMKGGPLSEGGQYIKIPFPPPGTIHIGLSFTGYDTFRVPRTLIPHISPPDAGSYFFPGKLDDLEALEYWQAPETHWSGGNQLFAYDLGVIKWNPELNSYTEKRPSTNEANNKDYFVWDKPVYALADGEVVSFEKDVDDNLHPGVMEGTGSGNFFCIRHGNEVVFYCHLQKGSIEERFCNQGATIKASDKLGRIGNSGHSSAPHIHIQAEKEISTGSGGGYLRPFLFRGISVISLSELMSNGKHSWINIDGSGLPAIPAAICPLFSIRLKNELIKLLDSRQISHGSNIQVKKAIDLLYDSFGTPSNQRSKNVTSAISHFMCR